MSEKDLGKALLNLSAMELAGMSDLQAANRTRAGARSLSRPPAFRYDHSGLAVRRLAYTGGAGGLRVHFSEAGAITGLDRRSAVTPAQRDELQIQILMAFMKGTLFVGFSVAMMTLAALSTVVLILASRRATLRQVNAGCRSPSTSSSAAGAGG